MLWALFLKYRSNEPGEPSSVSITTGMDGHLTAQQWMLLMERAVDALDARYRKLPLMRLLGR